MSNRNRSHRVRIGLVVSAIIACAASPSVWAREPQKDRAALLVAAGVPKPVELPHPQHAVALPDDDGNEPISVRLAQDPPAGPLSVRRVSIGGGRLYFGIRSAGGDLAGTAEVFRGGRQFQADIVSGELWLSLKPRIGKVTIHVSSPGMKSPVELVAPTTLVEVRGRQIYLNGEPFLVKGAMSRNLKEADAAYARSLGINTLRGQDALPDAERFGFMSIASLSFGQPGSKEAMKGTDAEWKTSLAGSMDWLRENCPPAIASPNTLIVQLGNEKTPGSNKAPGEPVPEVLARSRRHVGELLATAYNVIKPLAPSLPVGYSNQDFGFLLPDRMDVYMHNSFLTKDRYGRSWDEILHWQGCLPPDGPGGKGRPFVNSEFGANRYLCQSYHGGPNNPVLEKIHAWAFPNRWAEFMENGTAGGLIYCLYDLEQPRDQGSSRFGILTFEGQPKLACWEVGHMWRDFDVEVRGDKELVLSFKRDYHARDCRLTLTTPDGKSVARKLDDFAPHTSRTIPLADLSLASDAKEVRWQLDFTTHAGLVNQARGAWPATAEAHDFLERLKTRDTYPFLRELFDARVVTADGKPAPPTLAEMARPGDGIIPVALRKPNGVTYLLLIARENPDKTGPLRDGLTIDVAFKGKVEQIDDMTGQPLPGRTVDAAEMPTGLRLRNIQAARIPGAIGGRSQKPFMMPVYRITP
jgi:hypothetical protein